MSCCEPTVTSRFRGNFREKVLTEKFYARHDRLVPESSYRLSFELFARNIAKRQNYDPREERLAPLTENQVYGWLSHLVDDYSTGFDPILFRHHKNTHDVIKTQLRIMRDMLAQRKLK